MSLLYLIITFGFLQKFWNCFVKYYQDFVLFFVQMNFLFLLSEMAERHDVPQVLMMARDLVHKVQTLIENK